jgi:hypothetical protein
MTLLLMLTAFRSWDNQYSDPWRSGDAASRASTGNRVASRFKAKGIKKL